MDSILNSIKKLIGIHEDDESFDVDIIMHINSVFTVLNQLGVGPSNGFKIVDKEDTWDDYLSDENKIELVKSYMYLKIKLIFDPPASSAVIESINNQINEFEWRLNVESETNS